MSYTSLVGQASLIQGACVDRPVFLQHSGLFFLQKVQACVYEMLLAAQKSQCYIFMLFYIVNVLPLCQLLKGYIMSNITIAIEEIVMQLRELFDTSICNMG